MIPAAFEYERAESVEHAVQLLGRYGSDAKLLAGGHSLLPSMKLQRVSPRILIDVGRLEELAFRRDEGEVISIGPLTTQQELATDPLVTRACGLVSRAAAAIGDTQVRHRGTVGGSVAHADPAGDLPAALAAVDATFVLRGPAGERRVPASQFFLAPHACDLRGDELITEIRVPNLTGWECHYEKLANRATDWAIVAVGVAVVEMDGKVTAARVGLCNMGSTPLRAHPVERALVGTSPDDDAAAADAAALASQDTDPPDDLHASPRYRRHLATVLTLRSLAHTARSLRPSPSRRPGQDP